MDTSSTAGLMQSPRMWSANSVTAVNPPADVESGFEVRAPPKVAPNSIATVIEANIGKRLAAVQIPSAGAAKYGRFLRRSRR